MQKERTIGTTTLKTPYIGMGTWAIGGGTWWGENDDALSIRTIEEAIDRGIVWFDTAPVYGIGHSENVVGKAIKQNRSRILLSTKCGLEWDHETPCFHKVMEGRNVYRDLSARDRSFWWDLRESEKHRLWNRLRKNAVSGW